MLDDVVRPGAAAAFAAAAALVAVAPLDCCGVGATGNCGGARRKKNKEQSGLENK